MSAFFIATTTFKDMEKFQRYALMAAQTFTTFGGELVVRGKACDTLHGDSTHQGVGVVKFKDMATLKEWYQSADYQALIPLRNDAADMTIVAYEEPA